jgi:hypothetical protein
MLEDLHVVRDRGLRELDLGFDIARTHASRFANRALTLLFEHTQDTPARWIGDGTQLVGEMAVSVFRIHDHQYSYAPPEWRTTKSAPQRAFPKRNLKLLLKDWIVAVAH